jgi:hypothetical protein
MNQKPNKPAAPNAGIASRLTVGHHWPGGGEPGVKKLRFKWVLLLCAIPVCICLLPLGCRQGDIWRADLAVRPVVLAIEAFKTQNGRLPISLSELPEQKHGSAGLKLEDSSDFGLVWSIDYKNNSDGTYVLRFNHVHYDVSYKNGQRHDVEFNFFR